MKKQQTWFKVKGYPHIGYPIMNKRQIFSFIKNNNSIAKHAFLPFIHKQIITKKYRKEYDETDGSILHNGRPKNLKPKVRDIYYASHLDAHIYAYYAYILNKKYEYLIKQKKLEEVITAYRQIPLDKNDKKSRNKCNIDFANDIFNYIRNNSKKDNELVAIAFDIKGFFDNLKHDRLKNAWCDVLQKNRLPADHYNIFKHITKFSYVEEDELFQLFKDRIIVKNKSGKIRNKSVKRVEYMRNQGAIAFCEKKDIHLIRKKGLIYSNKYIKNNANKFVLNPDGSKKQRDYGICQGSPISAILANIYMLEFDEYINSEVLKIGGIYRRYSDDMVVICSKQYKQEAISLFTHAIENLTALEIAKEKTQIFHFTFDKDNKGKDRLYCYQEFKQGLTINSKNKNFEYLGFSFDGKYAYLKASTLAKYYQKMKTGVKRCAYYTKHINNDTNGILFKRRLYKRYSHMGAKRVRSYQGKKGNQKKKTRYNWGNFITYAYLASNTLDENKIRSQVKNHWKNLNNEIKQISQD